MRNFRTYQLAKELFHSVKALKLKGTMRDQIERASLSIVLNLAEGSAKHSQKERKHFFTTAMGSLRETQAIIELMNDAQLAARVDVIAAHLHKLIKPRARAAGLRPVASGHMPYP